MNFKHTGNKRGRGNPGSSDEAETQDGWVRVLGACKTLSEAGYFTAEALHGVCNFPEHGDTKGTQVASAWLGKLAAWGYVERGEPLKQPGRGRPANTYRVTTAGVGCVPRLGKLTRIIRMLDALRANRGRPREAELYHKLFVLGERIRDNKDLEKNDLGEDSL